MHATGLLQIAIVATVALVLGLALQRLRQPAIVGYIFAGVLLGPSGFGLISSERPVEILAEFGVLMLLFIIGMELSLRGFRRVLPVALGTTAAQVALSLAMMLLITKAFDRPTETGVVL
ncbi:MAG TPA: cation:proton antiporter, partial [Alphaproteobacteria bacterium]|nr:cation:proton antiporter [Alphaproteobacteria bacterium]